MDSSGRNLRNPVIWKKAQSMYLLIYPHINKTMIFPRHARLLSCATYKVKLVANDNT